jgi:hypothetical protein
LGAALGAGRGGASFHGRDDRVTTTIESRIRSSEELSEPYEPDLQHFLSGLELRMVETPKQHSVFVSYSWDSKDHKEWVLRLAAALQREPDVEVTLDQYDLWAGKDFTHFMERGLKCERIVVVSTPEYVRKSEERTGGVGYECSLITADLADDMIQDKFIPVLRNGNVLPSFLGAKLRLDFRDPRDFETELSRLLAAIRRQPESLRPAKREASDQPATPAREEAKPDNKSGPRLVLEGRFDHRRPTEGKQGMFLHNVGVGPAIQIEIDSIGRDPKCMNFGKIAVLRPDSDPVEVSISYVDARDVFEVGAYLSMTTIISGETSDQGDASSDDGQPLRIHYEDRHGTRHVDESYELRFHESTPFFAANAYYEVEKRSSTVEGFISGAKNSETAAHLYRPRVRLGRSRKRLGGQVDAKVVLGALDAPLFDVSNVGAEGAFDIYFKFQLTNKVTVKSRSIDHLPVGGEMTINHADLIYEQGGVISGPINLWQYIRTASLINGTVLLPLRTQVTYRDRHNQPHMTRYDVSDYGCSFISDDY